MVVQNDLNSTFFKTDHTKLIIQNTPNKILNFYNIYIIKAVSSAIPDYYRPNSVMANIG